MKLRRLDMTIGVAAAATLAATIWSWTVLDERRRAEGRTAEDLAACAALAAQIEALRARPRVAGSDEPPDRELAGRVERAAERVGISRDRVALVDPAPARRVADSAYKEKPTRIELRGVTLRQLVTLLHRVAAEREGLRVKRLRAVAPHGEEVGDCWNAEATLSHLIYAPEGT